jgi:two-component system chemotaxis response regulator CheY
MAEILIADDSKAIRQILKEILLMQNHTVFEATDGVEAVTLYQQHKPQIILLDYNMPNKDGLAALKEIIAFDPNAKIIMNTANDDDKITKEFLDAGAVTCITKPFDIPILLGTITQILKN